MVSINNSSRSRFLSLSNHNVVAKVCSLTFILAVGLIVYMNQSLYTDTLAHSRKNQSVDSLLGLRGSSFADNNDQCRFYLAESAIPMSGLGLFTAIDLAKGDQAQSMPDVCIYVADTPDGTAFETHSWARDVFIGTFEGRHPRAACEGFATLFNSMPDVGDVRTSVLVSMDHHTNGGLERFKDPGAGAITHYYGISSKAARDVSAGSELKINYGDWEYDRHKKYTAPTRSVDWLRTHGMCIDNIEIHPAVDHSMGRGAFAKRYLSKGQIVAPAPLQAFPHREAFAQQIPEALFVNYCFQPAGTDILLFPYGPGVNMINHGSGTKANVKVQWSKHYMSHNQWLDLPIDQFWQMNYPGALILDIVALRPIQPGEELFMDYGPAWEEAWNQHVAQWKPVDGQYMYVEDVDRSQPFKTVQEQEQSPYAPNLKTTCFAQNWDRDEYTRMRWVKPQFDYPEGLVYCNILSREYNKSTNEYEYEVSLLFNPMRPDKQDKQKYVDTNVPHSAIFFVDKPYMSDLHLPNAFRHPIALPDELIPEPWLISSIPQ